MRSHMKVIAWIPNFEEDDGCCAITKTGGKRCSRNVKALSKYIPTYINFVPRFCFQHEDKPTGFHSHKEGGGWVDFADWIPNYLDDKTQTALRKVMQKPASLADEPGYVYAYEIRDDRAPTEITIKIGRAVLLVKGLNQWCKKCPSKDVVLRGWWPGTVENVDGTNGTSLLRRRINAGEKGPHCHRLKSLVRLELAGLAVHAPYLEPEFPNVNSKAEGSGSSSARRATPCIDCGIKHKDIFTFRRIRKGKGKGKEWERLVEPVIAKWTRFVRDYV